MNDTLNEKPITLKRLKILSLGSKLLILFLASLIIIGIWFVVQLVGKGFQTVISDYWGRILLIILIENIIFWSGIIMVYLTSVQLGIKMRVLGLICGWMPIVHLIVLTMIIRITLSEAMFEKAKIKLNRSRASEQICKTRYPILMVHGVFFRDFKYFNYWGRVPAELEKTEPLFIMGITSLLHQSQEVRRNWLQELKR